MQTRRGRIVIAVLVGMGLIATAVGAWLTRTPRPERGGAPPKAEGQARPPIAARTESKTSGGSEEAKTSGAAVGEARDTPALKRAAPEPETPAERFARARERLENNLGDAVDASRSELLASIEEIRSALNDGLEDRKSAYKEIAAGYRSIAFRHSKPLYGPECMQFLARAASAYREVIELDPMDTDARLEYAAMLKDEEMAFAQVQEAVRRTPDHAGAQYAYAASLMKRGKTREAVAAYTRALMLFEDPELVQRRGDGIVWELRYRGLAGDADRIERWLAARKQARQDGGEGER